MPTWLLYTLGVLIFAFGLLLSIALHEIGHMVPAKKFGVKVTQYMVGFGPTVWSRKRGDTEYGLKAIPLGGYIRMIGMVPPRADGKVSRWPRRMATAIEDFRQVSRAEVQIDDEHRQFYRLTPGKKMIVMLGGPCMNLLIYLVLTVFLVMTIGVPHADETTRVASITKCLVPATSTDATKTTCPAGAKDAPAYHRLQPGDRILAVDGTPIKSWSQLVAIIEPSANKPLAMQVQRKGQIVSISITPVRNLKYVNGSSTKTKEAGYLGISAAVHQYYETLPITGVPGQIGSQLNLGVQALGRYPEKIASLYRTVFDGQKRDPQGAVGVVGIGRISGDLRQQQADHHQGQDLYAHRPARQRQPPAVLLQPAAAAAAGRRARRRRAGRGGQAGTGPPARAPATGRPRRHRPHPHADLRRHRADAAGDVRGGLGADRGDLADPLRRHRQAHHAVGRIMES